MVVEPSGAPGTRASWSAPPPAWLAWNGGAVRQLAEVAYQERETGECVSCDGKGQHRIYRGEPSQGHDDTQCPWCDGTGRVPTGRLDATSLAVLADALEEAGATDADLLNHLRGPGPHVRGCWVIDLLLGKG